MKCKYSLIVPVYQVTEYITECFESVFCQLPPDVQVILIDDGSTDGSGEICDQYARRYPQIEVIHQANKGVAAARNTGLNAARGEYLLWIDPDDWVSADWFASIDEIITRDAPDILVFDYIEWEDGEETQRAYGRSAGRIDKELFLHDVTRDIRMNSSLWNKVIRKSLYEGVCFNENLKCLEDYALLHELIMRADSVMYRSLFLYVYRIRNSGLVRTPNLRISYQSYLTAIERKKEIEATGRRCSDMGCVLQARGFCRNYYRMGLPRAFEREFDSCRNMILSHIWQVLTEKELILLHRIKLVLVAFPLLGRIYYRR